MGWRIADAFPSDVAVGVDDENGSGREPVTVEVEDAVIDGDIVVFAGVEDGEFRPGFGDYRFGSAEVVGADSEDLGSGVCDLVVVFLQLT